MMSLRPRLLLRSLVGSPRRLNCPAHGCMALQAADVSLAEHIQQLSHRGGDATRAPRYIFESVRESEHSVVNEQGGAQHQHDAEAIAGDYDHLPWFFAPPPRQPDPHERASSAAEDCGENPGATETAQCTSRAASFLQHLRLVQRHGPAALSCGVVALGVPVGSRRPYAPALPQGRWGTAGLSPTLEHRTLLYGGRPPCATRSETPYCCGCRAVPAIHQFFVGGSGSGAPLHFHGAAWNALAFGAKRWPACTLFIS